MIMETKNTYHYHAVYEDVPVSEIGYPRVRLRQRGVDMRGIVFCAVTLLAMLVMAACSQSPPTPYPTATPWIVTATPGPTSTPWIVTPTPRPKVLPTATPPLEARFIPPTPPGPGVCGRTPEVQKTLIETLQIASCRLITEQELYRIRELPGIRAPGLKAGDFAGLVNLESLSVTLRPSEDGVPAMIPEGVFADSRIKRLNLGGPVTVEDGAFDGAYVESLSISLAAVEPIYDRQGEFIGYRPAQLPDRIPESLTQLSVVGNLKQLDWKIFQTLPELETLSLEDIETQTPAFIDLPTDAFESNPELKSLELKLGYWPSETEGGYRAAGGFLAEHEHLSRVFIDKLFLPGPQPDGLPIRLHPDSPAAVFVATEGTRGWTNWEEGSFFKIP